MTKELVFAESPVADRWREHYTAAIDEDKAEHIINKILKYRGHRWEELTSRWRKREHVYTRQLCFYFLRKKTELTAKCIGEKFGDRDHTTVLHGAQKIKDLLCVYEEVQNEINEINAWL